MNTKLNPCDIDAYAFTNDSKIAKIEVISASEIGHNKKRIVLETVDYGFIIFRSNVKKIGNNYYCIGVDAATSLLKTKIKAKMRDNIEKITDFNIQIEALQKENEELDKDFKSNYEFLSREIINIKGSGKRVGVKIQDYCQTTNTTNNE